MLNSAEISVGSGVGSPLGGRSPSKLSNFMGTDNSVHKIGQQVAEDEVTLEWVEVAKTIASAGAENLEQVMDSLQEVMTQEVEEISVAGARGFGKVSLHS